MNEYAGDLIGSGLKIAIVLSRFNSLLSEKLLSGANDALVRHGVSDNDIDVYRVPGAVEIPLVAKNLAQTKKYDAVICLGVIIRGGTPHFDYVANEVAKGVGKISYDIGVPAIFGIITADTIEQAIERAGTKMGNKGADAAESAIEMANLIKTL